MMKKLILIFVMSMVLTMNAGVAPSSAKGESKALASSDVTREIFFKSVKKRLNSMLSFGQMKAISEGAFDIRHLPRMLSPEELSVDGEKRVIEKIIKDVLINSYGLKEVTGKCSNALFSSGGYSGGINYFNVCNHYCDIYDPKASLCGEVGGFGVPKRKVLDNFAYVERLENDCPEILSYYKDYNAFVDTAVKEIIGKKKRMRLAELKQKEDEKILAMKRQARLKQARMEEKRQARKRKKEMEIARQKLEEQRRQEELERRKEEKRKKQVAMDLELQRQAEKETERKEHARLIKAGKIPVENIDDAVIYHGAKNGYGLIHFTPIEADSKVYRLGGTLVMAKSGGFVVRNGKRLFYFTLNKPDMAQGLRLRSRIEIVGRFVLVHNGYPGFLAYYVSQP